MTLNFNKLAKTAIKAALAAGKVIQEAQKKTITVQKKDAGNTLASQVVTAIDLQCESIILEHLKPTCTTFDIALLSEETPDDGSRFIKDYFWCIDPMDGTLAFINKHPGYAVSIALVAKDGTPCIGVVYDPSTRNMYHAIKHRGAFKNGQPWQPSIKNSFLSYITDKTLKNTPNKALLEKLLDDKLQELQLKTVIETSGGGAVLNAIKVAENGPAVLLKIPKKEKGGGSIWDFAATACLFQELGLKATDYYGNQLKLNGKSTFMNAFGIRFSNLE